MRNFLLLVFALTGILGVAGWVSHGKSSAGYIPTVSRPVDPPSPITSGQTINWEVGVDRTVDEAGGCPLTLEAYPAVALEVIPFAATVPSGSSLSKAFAIKIGSKFTGTFVVTASCNGHWVDSAPVTVVAPSVSPLQR